MNDPFHPKFIEMWEPYGMLRLMAVQGSTLSIREIIALGNRMQKTEERSCGS